MATRSSASHRAIAAPDGVEVIEAGGKLVVPGFVNAHYHSHDVLLKGMFEEMPFDIWAVHTNAASYGRRSLHELRIRTLIGAAEMLRNGITTVQDFLTVYPADDAIVDTSCRPTRRPASACLRDRRARPRRARHRAADDERRCPKASASA